jgi:hypothetical protein
MLQIGHRLHDLNPMLSPPVAPAQNRAQDAGSLVMGAKYT